MLQHVNRWMKTGTLNGLLVLLIVLGASSCKSKKKMREVSNKEPMEKVEKDISYDNANKEMENDANKAKTAAPATLSSKLSGYFAAISSAPTVASANSSINEALMLFASPGVPVFIIIYESPSGEVDYDEPTTAEKYLNYLKDQKKNLNNIRDMKTNASGKITELELIKR
jgi:hypothetical protein